MENAILWGSVLGPLFLILGLSQLIYAGAWGRVIEKWEKDHYDLLPLMFMSAILGLLIINSYNVWEWNVWIIVTITGWLALIKSVVYFLLPGQTIKSILNLGKKLIYLGGLIGTVVGAVLSYFVYLK